MRTIAAILATFIALLGGIVSKNCDNVKFVKEPTASNGYEYINAVNNNVDETAASLTAVSLENLTDGKLIVPHTLDEYNVEQIGYRRYSAWGGYSDIGSFGAGINEVLISDFSNMYIWYWVLYQMSDLQILRVEDVGKLMFFVEGSSSTACCSTQSLKYISMLRTNTHNLWFSADATLRYLAFNTVNKAGVLSYRDNLTDDDVTHKLQYVGIEDVEEVYLHLEEAEQLSAFVLPADVDSIKDLCINDNTTLYVRGSQEWLSEKTAGLEESNLHLPQNVVFDFVDEIVVFDSDDGTDVVFDATGKNYIVASVGDKLTEPTAPTKDGYTFGGWYKDYYYDEEWDFATDTVTGSACLFAKWIAAA